MDPIIQARIKEDRRALTPWHLIRQALIEEHDEQDIDAALSEAKRCEALQLDHDATLTTGLAASIRRDLGTLETLQAGDMGGKSLLDILKLRQSLRKELADLYMPAPKYDGAAVGNAFGNLAARYGKGAQ